MIYRRLFGATIALVLVFLVGATGYMAIEGWSFLDSLYMTVITVASVGFMEVHPLSEGGRIFTIALILWGSGTLIFGFSALTAFIVEGELTDVLRRRKMKNRIGRLAGHYIVCGVSATGGYVIHELAKTGQKFVVIDKDPNKIRELTEENLLCIEGNATHEAVLEAANIRQAGGLLTALHHDADNIMTVVTARGLNSGIKIVAKAIDEESEKKLRQVGADRVVMPNYIGGLRMASEMIRPSVVSFLDNMLREKGTTMRVEEVALSPASRLVGKTLQESGVMDIEGVTLVAIRDGDGAFTFNPRRQCVLEPESVLIVMGSVSDILALKEQATVPATAA